MERIIFFVFISFLAKDVLAQKEDIKQQFPQSFVVTISNPLNIDRQNEMIVVPETRLEEGFNSKAFVVMDGVNEIPSQYNHHDKDFPGIVFVLDKLAAKEQRKIIIRYNSSGVAARNYVKRTQAELSHKVNGKFINREYVGGEFQNVEFLRVPSEHKDHSWFIRYEGPGWESDKVGYRFYLDQRNATDVFGKTTDDMVLQHIGLDGFDSYHQMQPWGMDVMKVGKSLGLATPGMYKNNKVFRIEDTDSVDCRIVENGPVFSSITTHYYGWNVNNVRGDVTSRATIHAGTRLTHLLLTTTGNIDSLCTGIVKDKEAIPITYPGDKSHFGYIATYGKQSLNNDKLGLAVFFRAVDYMFAAEDANSNIVILNSNQKNIDYYFMAAWEREPMGINNEEQFKSYLQKISQCLAFPVNVLVDKPSSNKMKKNIE